MVTRSFLKNIVIKDRKSANSLVSALENAENKSKKEVTIRSKVKTIDDKDTIKKMFEV